MKFAAIDIGTNSIRLLIAEYDGEKMHKLVNKLRTPRLGEGINAGMINEQAQIRACQVLVEYKELIDEYQADCRAVATSAIRDAENKDQFLEKVKKESGIEIDVINGAQEAKLSYLGIANGLKQPPSNLLAVDIGGGSTELVFGTENDVTEYNSINLGAVRLKESWKEDLEAMRSAASDKIQTVIADANPKMLVGVGGTITTLAAIEQSLEEYQPEKIQNYELHSADIKKMLKRLSELELAERKKVVGLSKDRADIIIPGIIILLEVMNNSQLEKIKVSDFGILEGIIYNKFK